MNKLDMQSEDMVVGNIEKIAQMFPSTVVESDKGLAIDFDLLKQELCKDILDDNSDLDFELAEQYEEFKTIKEAPIIEQPEIKDKTLNPLIKQKRLKMFEK